MDEYKLKELADREEIAFLLHEYCRILDAMDLDTLAAIFTDDCVVEYGPEERLQSRGKAAVRQGLERLGGGSEPPITSPTSRSALPGPIRQPPSATSLPGTSGRTATQPRSGGSITTPSCAPRQVGGWRAGARP